MITPDLSTYEYRAAREIARAKYYRENGCDTMANHTEIVSHKFNRLVETTRRWAVMAHVPLDERSGRTTYDPYNNVHPLIAPVEPGTCGTHDTVSTHRTHNPENIEQV